jgi:hypothetical protein
MGTYVTLIDSQVSWKDAAARAAALPQIQATLFTDQALLALADGGNYGGTSDQQPVAQRRWYSGTNTLICRSATDIADILGEFFDRFDDQGETHWQLTFDNKLGQNQLLMETLAPFIAAGSYLSWEDEDGDRFRWEFDGTVMAERHLATAW